MKIRMMKSGKTRDLPQERAESLIRVGEAELLEEKSQIVPPKKIPLKKKSSSYKDRQMRVGKRHYKRKSF